MLYDTCLKHVFRDVPRLLWRCLAFAMLSFAAPASWAQTNTFPLSVTKSGNGTVATTYGAINCGTICTANFNSGTELALSATPAAGYTFQGWGGACNGGAGGTGTCIVTMTAARSVVANFAAITYPLTVSVSGSGSVVSSPAGINCGTACSANFNSGTNLTLTANPAAGQQFSAWGGACTGSTTTCTVPMSQARSVTASFVVIPPTTFTLSVTKSGNGTVATTYGAINCGALCSANFNSGTELALTATPAAGYTFSGWGGACSGTANRCVVTMTAARSVVANFAAITNPLTVSVSGSGSVASSPAGISCGTACSASFNSGTSVTLTANPASGQQFSAWGGACTGSTATCVVSMSQARSVTASFAAITYPLTVSVSGSGSVASSPAGISCGTACSASFNSGTSVTLTANPASGQQFSAWGGACTGSTTTCTVPMSQARSVTASFAVATAPGALILYFSDCQTDAAPGCVPGNNVAVGTQAAPKQNLAGIDLNTLPAGSTLYFKRGGSWNQSNARLYNRSTTAAAPLTFDAYGSGAAPLFRTVSGVAFETANGYYDTTPTSGYVFRNLKFDGVGSGQNAFWLKGRTSNVIFDNVEITGFYTAFELQSGDGHDVAFLTVRNSRIVNNRGMGAIGTIRDSLIEGNLFQGLGTGANTVHAIYLSHGNRIVVRNNQFVRNSINAQGACTGGNLTAHGFIDGLLMEGNTIVQDDSTQSCYGISVMPYGTGTNGFRNLVVRNNTVVNTGGASIYIATAPGALVEGNRIIRTNGLAVSTWHSGILVMVSERPEDLQGGGEIVRNNIGCYSGAGESLAGNLVSVQTSATLSNNVSRIGAEATTGVCAR